MADPLAIAELLAAYSGGTGTVSQHIASLLADVARIDRPDEDAKPGLNSLLRVNPDALWLARARDAATGVGEPPGPLHGVPILLKDNVDTGDSMPTSAGALALAESYALRDAPLVQWLRQAGAIILGKTNMTELANYMTTGMPGGYSSLGGQVRNAHHRQLDVAGSSSGSAVAVAAGLCSVAIGTETSGSILRPAEMSGVVGIKPTVGLVSRSGIVPICSAQDTAGPLARSVADAALVLTVISGRDESDPATLAAPDAEDYANSLDSGGAHGARVGVPRATFWEGHRPEFGEVLERAVSVLTDLGIDVVDPAEFESAQPVDGWATRVMLLEFKSSMNAYLHALGPGAPMKSIRDIITFNNAHPRETLRYGQVQLLRAERETTGRMVEREYLEGRAHDLSHSRQRGIDGVLEAHGLDAILFPGSAGAAISARAGYPTVHVPLGFVDVPDARPKLQPIGVSFAGTAFSESRLIQIAYAFEQATQARRRPQL